jgi:hypothetical protein
MSLAGSRLLGLAGVLALLAFFAAGIATLMYPLPPAATRGPAAASLCLEGVVVLAVTNCISFYMGMLATAKNRREGEAISQAMFNVILKGFSLIRGAAKGRSASNRRRHHAGRSS